MSKNVAVFVDVANIFYAAKAAGVDIDYVTLLRSATAGRDLVRAYAYTGLDPENDNQRQFHSFLARSGFKVVSKDIRKYGDGRIKANLDIELVVDMMRMADHLDICVVVSGDGDFAPAIRAVQQIGVRVEVVSFRGNTSSDLIEVADVFADITHLARVEKGARSGRRVAAEGDLSMTAVPEKESEGPVRRRRTRRDQQAGAEDGGRPAASAAAAGPAMPGNLIVLPGERLSRADGSDEPEEAELAPATTTVEAVGVEEDLNGQGAGGDAQRRRRRRGGRGRGRGRRGEAEESLPVAEVGGEEDEYLDEVPPPVPQHSTFGSVWDTQLGVPTSPPPPTGEVPELEYEDEDEPAVPEYLLTERRQRGRRDQRSGRGGRDRAGYRTALDRERFGRGGAPNYGAGPRGAERQRGGQDRRPQGAPPRPERPQREPTFAARPAAPPSAAPWSEVPPEVQELLRAELARRGRPSTGTPGPEVAPSTDAPELEELPAEGFVGDAFGASSTAARPETEPPPRRRTTRSRRTAATSVDDAPVATEEAPAPPKRATRSRRTATATADTTATATEDPTTAAGGATVTADGAEEAATAARKRRTTTRRAPARSRTAGAATEATQPATADVAPEADAAPDATAKPAPRRRTTRRSTATAQPPATTEERDGT